MTFHETVLPIRRMEWLDQNAALRTSLSSQEFRATLTFHARQVTFTYTGRVPAPDAFRTRPTRAELSSLRYTYQSGRTAGIS